MVVDMCFGAGSSAEGPPFDCAQGMDKAEYIDGRGYTILMFVDVWEVSATYFSRACGGNSLAVAGVESTE
jgi:hypothetical protein